MRRIGFVLGFLICCVVASVGQWHDDVLPGYESRTVAQADDYSGRVVSTVVHKKQSACVTDSVHKGVLYVHGFNDYFFQSELGERFAAHGYDFYAVDLRKYGRSILPGQKPFQVRAISEYYADIDSALAVMKQAGVSEVVLMGHSTGGLVTACFMAEHPDRAVKCLVLNSPFLDWNLSPMMERIVPVVAVIGRWWPDMKISQDKSTGYSDSLLKGHGGEWYYNTDWKKRQSPDVDAGWVRAIDMGQNLLKSGDHPIEVPILLMVSDHSGEGGDMVLDVKDISNYGRRLGPEVTEVTVPGGYHDLALSKAGIRCAMYCYMFKWLNRHI